MADIYIDGIEKSGYSASGMPVLLDATGGGVPGEPRYLSLGQLNWTEGMQPLGTITNTIHIRQYLVGLDFGTGAPTETVENFSEKIFPSKTYLEAPVPEAVPNKYGSLNPVNVIISQIFSVPPWYFTNNGSWGDWGTVRYSRTIKNFVMKTINSTEELFNVTLTFSFNLSYVSSSIAPNVNNFAISVSYRQGANIFYTDYIGLATLDLIPNSPDWQTWNNIVLTSGLGTSDSGVISGLDQTTVFEGWRVYDGGWTVAHSVSTNVWNNPNFGPAVLFNKLNNFPDSNITSHYAYLMSNATLLEGEAKDEGFTIADCDFLNLENPTQIYYSSPNHQLVLGPTFQGRWLSLLSSTNTLSFDSFKKCVQFYGTTGTLLFNNKAEEGCYFYPNAFGLTEAEKYIKNPILVVVNAFWDYINMEGIMDFSTGLLNSVQLPIKFRVRTGLGNYINLALTITVAVRRIIESSKDGLVANLTVLSRSQLPNESVLTRIYQIMQETSFSFTFNRDTNPTSVVSIEFTNSGQETGDDTLSIPLDETAICPDSSYTITDNGVWQKAMGEIPLLFITMLNEYTFKNPRGPSTSLTYLQPFSYMFSNWLLNPIEVQEKVRDIK
jgi:hypothetical protein